MISNVHQTKDGLLVRLIFPFSVLEYEYEGKYSLKLNIEANTSSGSRGDKVL